MSIRALDDNNTLAAHGVQLKRQDGGEPPDGIDDGVRMNGNYALQRQSFGQPLPNDGNDDSNTAELMNKLKAILNQEEGEQDGDEDDEDDDDEEESSDGVRMNGNYASQMQHFGEPLPNDGNDGSNTAELMNKLKAILNQEEGEQDEDEDDEDDDDEEESNEFQPAKFNEKLLDDDKEEAVEQSSYYYAKKYHGQVIYIESYRRRGRWLDSSRRRGSAYFSAVPEESTVDKLGVKWRVKNVGRGAVVLENMLYRHHYLDAHHSRWCKVTYSSYPKNKIWAKFKIENRYGRFLFRSVRYSNLYLDEYESWLSKYYAKLVAGTGIYAQFRIYIPPKSNYYKTVATLDNRKGKSTRQFEYQEEVGITTTKGYEISTTLASEIGLEIKKAFSLGLSSSTTWKTFHHSTYSRKTRYTLKSPIPPGKIVHVKQLMGDYGHYHVQAKHFMFVDMDLQANTQRVVFACGMDEYNRGEFLPNPDGFGGE